MPKSTRILAACAALLLLAACGSAPVAGDDIPDIECIRWAGLGIAVGDAVPEVVLAADMKTVSCAGFGAVRECAEHILKINEGKSE